MQKQLPGVRPKNCPCYLLCSNPFQFNSYVLSIYYSFNKYLLRAYHMHSMYNVKNTYEKLWASPCERLKKKNDYLKRNTKKGL